MSYKKGRKFEYLVKRKFEAKEFKVERLLLSGQKRGFDLLVDGRIKVECKKRYGKKSVTISRTFLKKLKDKEIDVIAISPGKREPVYVVLRLDDYLELLKHEGAFDRQ